MNENANKGNRKNRMTSRKKENDKTKIREIRGRNSKIKSQIKMEMQKIYIADKETTEGTTNTKRRGAEKKHRQRMI